MPKACDYMNCPRICSTSFAPFCSEYHMLAAQKREMQEKLARVQEKLKELETSMSPGPKPTSKE